MAKGRTIDAAAKPDRKAKKPAGRGVSSRARKAADETAAKVKAAGATGTFGPAEKRSIRDSLIIARHLARTPQKDIAAEAGVSVRTVRVVIAAFKSTPSPVEQLPMEIVEELLRVMRLSAADFEAMAFRQEERNPNVALGAKKAAQDARRDFVTMLFGMGKLPDNLELFRMESELARLGQLVMGALRSVAEGRESAEQAQERVLELVQRRELPLLEGNVADPR